MRISHLYTRTRLDLLLAVVATISVWVMLSASSDPVVSWLRGTPIEAAFRQSPAGNQVAFGLAVGVFTALLTYYLLVRLPEHDRNARIKKHLVRSYIQFKEAVVAILVSSVHGVYDPSEIEKLCNHEMFRAYFKQPYAPRQTIWDAVANCMDDFILRQLVLEVEVLRGEFQYAISAIDIRDPEVYEFVKRLSSALYRAKNWSSDYDGTNQGLGFFWQLLAGWDPIKGYTGRDYVMDMIRQV